MSFSQFGLDPRVSAAIPASFISPTPIQTQAIPVVLQGKDLLGLAQTGTGKTAAFVLPILHRLLTTPPKGERGNVRALIIAPTRELAEQICAAVRELGARAGFSSTTIYGGVSMTNQIHRLRRGVDIVVGCPGRILDHMKKRTLNLHQLEMLVLDEADHMFDMGFIPTIRQILRSLPREKQTMLFSATMPDEIRKLVMEILRDPQTVQIGIRSPATTVEHCLYRVDQARKSDLLLALISATATDSVLVFTRTKHRAKRVSQTLLEAGLSATSLQGNLSQQRRETAIKGFRAGKYRIMVATDIAARGIDVSSVTHVINYDMPDTVDAYTHRIGRTGRAQRNGDAITFVTPQDVGMLRSIERVLKNPIPHKEMTGLSLAITAFSSGSTSESSKNDSPRRYHARNGSGGNERGRFQRRSNRFSQRGPRHDSREYRGDRRHSASGSQAASRSQAGSF